MAILYRVYYFIAFYFIAFWIYQFSRLISHKLPRHVVKYIGFDVDGTLTNGEVWYSDQGRLPLLRFSRIDGYGFVRLKRYKVVIFILSGSSGKEIEARAKDLGIEMRHTFQGVHEKLDFIKATCPDWDLKKIAFMGDDVADLDFLRAIGVSATPRDARKDVRIAVDYVAKSRGGKGAAREFIDALIDNNNFEKNL